MTPAPPLDRTFPSARWARRFVGFLLALLVLAGITLGVNTHLTDGLDKAVAGDPDRHRLLLLYGLARAGFTLGQNGIFPLAAVVLSVWLAVRRRSVRPVIAVGGVFVVQNLVVGLAKLWAGRQAPGSGDLRLHAVTSDLNQRLSYPSGHAANIVVYTAVVGVLAVALTGNRRWAARLTAVTLASLLVCISAMLYLSFHWVTDAAAGIALGVAVRCLLAPAFAAALGRPKQPAATRTQSPMEIPEEPVSGCLRS